VDVGRILGEAMTRQFSLRCLFAVLCVVNVVFALVAFRLRLEDARKRSAAPIHAAGGYVEHAWFSARIRSAILTCADLGEPELAQVIEALEEEPRLRTVVLSISGITDQGMDKVARLDRIRELWLDHTVITDKGIYALRHLGSLEVLNVAGTQVTAKGIAQLGGHAKLRSLNMAATMVDDDDLAHLCVFADSLQVLDLAETSITSAGLQRLACLPHLRELDISDTRIDEDAFHFIEKLPALRVLHIFSLSLDQHSIDELEKKRPHLEIQRGDRLPHGRVEAAGSRSTKTSEPLPAMSRSND
jgi:hypothetical protein